MSLDLVSILAAKKAEALNAAERMADDFQAKILGTESSYQQARLNNKYQSAIAIKENRASEGDYAVIDAEVELRPKYNREQLVEVIINKGNVAKRLEGTVNAMLLLAEDRINAATTMDDLNSIAIDLKNQGKSMMAEFLEG